MPGVESGDAGIESCRTANICGFLQEGDKGEAQILHPLHLDQGCDIMNFTKAHQEPIQAKVADPIGSPSGF
jgi:hypothetical protein